MTRLTSALLGLAVVAGLSDSSAQADHARSPVRNRSVAAPYVGSHYLPSTGYTGCSTCQYGNCRTDVGYRNSFGFGSGVGVNGRYGVGSGFGYDRDLYRSRDFRFRGVTTPYRSPTFGSPYGTNFRSNRYYRSY